MPCVECCPGHEWYETRRCLELPGERCHLQEFARSEFECLVCRARAKAVTIDGRYYVVGDHGEPLAELTGDWKGESADRLYERFQQIPGAAMMAAYHSDAFQKDLEATKLEAFEAGYAGGIKTALAFTHSQLVLLRQLAEHPEESVEGSGAAKRADCSWEEMYRLADDAIVLLEEASVAAVGHDGTVERLTVKLSRIGVAVFCDKKGGA